MSEEWYSNKELFEQIQALRSEMSETRSLIKQYNGLREEVEEVKEKMVRIEAISAGKNKVLEAIRNWGGWTVAIIALILNFIN
ncbi:hypothetical protein MTP04_24280 [Lysinibacillus sp. PLM2]|nr:hypothetical protein MTP04_24280 [Lysinibacillus sp. PLM2]